MCVHLQTHINHPYVWWCIYIDVCLGPSPIDLLDCPSSSISSNTYKPVNLSSLAKHPYRGECVEITTAPSSRSDSREGPWGVPAVCVCARPCVCVCVCTSVRQRLMFQIRGVFWDPCRCWRLDVKALTAVNLHCWWGAHDCKGICWASTSSSDQPSQRLLSPPTEIKSYSTTSQTDAEISCAIRALVFIPSMQSG